MPTAMQTFFWPATHAGISYKELMYDYEKNKEIGFDVVREFEPDGVYTLVLAARSGPCWTSSTSSSCNGRATACATTSPTSTSIAST